MTNESVEKITKMFHLGIGDGRVFACMTFKPDTPDPQMRDFDWLDESECEVGETVIKGDWHCEREQDKQS